MSSTNIGVSEVNFYNPISFALRRKIKRGRIIPVHYLALLIKNLFVIPKWLPPIFAISIVFLPNSLLLIKFFGALVAVILFYYSISSNNDISSKDLIK